jgi:hypothetical protein
LIISIAVSKTPSREQTRSWVSQQQRVGAQIDMALAVDDAPNQFLQLGIQRRLSAADRHPRGTGFIDGLQAAFQR